MPPAVRNPLYLLPVTLVLAACAAAWKPQPEHNPEQFSSYQSVTDGDFSVAVAILTDEEAKGHFGADLGERQIQAIWVRVRNASDHRYWFIRNTVDRDLYSADEAALAVRDQVAEEDFEALRQHFRDESIRVLMEPGHVTQGHLFVPKKEGGRYVEIRLASDAYESEQAESDRREGSFRELRFGFGLTLPDGEFDYEQLGDLLDTVAQDRRDLDSEGLRRVLETLPCCVTNADADRDGDPLNIVLVGERRDLMNVLSRCGWSFTHRITPGSVKRMVAAALEGKGYAVAPVSSLYSFGRSQDIALQRARQNISQRNHMRLWLAPFTHEGRSVWVGQVSRDIGVKMTPKSPTLTTHIIDPDVDLTREYLLHSLLAEGFVSRFGFVGGSRAATIDEPAFNLTDDRYYSDGLRLVVMLSPHPLPYSEVRSLLWEESDAPVAEGQTRAANRNVWPIGAERLKD